jgi:hypothetical protein
LSALRAGYRDICPSDFTWPVAAVLSKEPGQLLSLLAVGHQLEFKGLKAFREIKRTEALAKSSPRAGS